MEALYAPCMGGGKNFSRINRSNPYRRSADTAFLLTWHILFFTLAPIATSCCSYPAGRARNFEEGTDMPARKENLYVLRDLALPKRTGRLSKEDLQALKTIADWTRDFVAQSHPHLGRGGPVCPFVPPAIENDTLWFAVEHIRQYQGLWCTLYPTELIEGGRCLCQATRKSPSVPGVSDR